MSGENKNIPWIAWVIVMVITASIPVFAVIYNENQRRLLETEQIKLEAERVKLEQKQREQEAERLKLEQRQREQEEQRIKLEEIRLAKERHDKELERLEKTAQKVAENRVQVNNMKSLLINQFYTVNFKNICDIVVGIAVIYKTLTGAWIKSGWWSPEPNTTADPGIITKNAYIYYYAENRFSKDRSLVWKDKKGLHVNTVIDEAFSSLDHDYIGENTRHLSFRQLEIPKSYFKDTYTVDLTCN